ncbi:MAG: TolC family protein [Bacteroidetes bacterium]|jgi:outer membrane protein|nr:TolC family protein [Bacteroidota bacterium]
MKKWLLVVCIVAAAQVKAQQKLSLSDAIAIALKNSYDVELVRNQLSISTINNNPGVAGALPTVNLTASDNEQVISINQKFPDATRNTERNNVGSNILSVGVTGSILLYNGNRVVATQKRLAQLQQLNTNVLNAQLQNTMATVAVRYYEIVRQQELLKTIQKSIAVFQKRLDVLEARKEAGLANNADIYQAKLDLNGQKQALETQYLIIKQSKADLLQSMVQAPDSAIVIDDKISIDQSLALESIKNALPTNPQYIAAATQISINQLIEKETAALRTPTLRATTGFNISSNKSAAGFILLNQSYGPFVGINLSVPIYNGSVFKRQSQVAAINTRSAKLQQETVALNLETSAVKTFNAYSNALAQLQTEKDNYALSGQLLDLVMQKFELAQATIIDVRQAQQSFENAGYRLVNLEYTAKIAEIELNRLVSKLAL